MATLTEKILTSHLITGIYKKDSQIGIQIDQTLTQDATGTMAYLQLEAMGIDKVKTELSVSYVDHNTLQNGFENADDHKYLQTVANAYGILFSKPGNGICHQVHLERFAIPGKTLLGSDSHTPTAGGIGSLAIGAGGLDVACAMAGQPFFIKVPEVINIQLEGKLQKGVSSKDIILKILQLLTVKGGVGKVIEYSGNGIKHLNVPARATICNMGAELGATTSIFPSDEVTKSFLEKQNRGETYQPLNADKDAVYDAVYSIDLTTLEPMIALPHSPDNVKTVREVAGTKVDQVAIGSCTNSSYYDLTAVGTMLKKHTIHPDVSLAISPGSKQVYQMIINNGSLSTMIASGARILESTCGPCIGMGQAPSSNAVSLRTFNRNFYGRSGTLSASVYLVSPETAVASAIYGEITDPRILDYEEVEEPDYFHVDDRMIISPTLDKTTPIIRGPNIKPLPINQPLENKIIKKVMIKVEDNITTDHIAPAGAKVLPYRSNIEKISEFVFMNNKPDFYDTCKKYGGGFIIAGHNYGQGSSREHAALAPMHLGIKAVLAKSFARIHHANLVNFGILPLQFINEKDYDSIEELDELMIEDTLLINTNDTICVFNKTKKETYICKHQLSVLDIAIIKAGGMLNYIRNKN